MLGICLSALMSGVIGVSGMQYSVDTNNGVLYTHEDKVEYVLPDKFNLVQLCEQEERFAVNTVKPFNLIKTIE